MTIFFAIVGGVFISGVGACLVALAYKGIKETREQRLYWWEHKKLVQALLEIRDRSERKDLVESIDKLIVDIKTWGRF